MNDPFDERRHQVGGQDWLERWQFESWSRDGTFGAIAAITLVPASRHAWYWAAVARDARPLLTLVDTELHLPASSLTLRGASLWADHVCETPLEHWTVANEAYAVSIDDPEEAHGSQRGDIVPVGFDLEWEAADDPTELADGYVVSATVTGEILIGDENLGIDTEGRWRHEWGALRWPEEPGRKPHGLRAPLRIDPAAGPVVLVERVVDQDGWHEWLRPGDAP
ncbi:MAG TPA: hypothetical protein VK461_16805 [Acidimicrobiales bacterium]|nr:hypothetical protein [Acidimicrobiales bacterium]